MANKFCCSILPLYLVTCLYILTLSDLTTGLIKPIKTDGNLTNCTTVDDCKGLKKCSRGLKVCHEGKCSCIYNQKTGALCYNKEDCLGCGGDDGNRGNVMDCFYKDKDGVGTCGCRKCVEAKADCGPCFSFGTNVKTPVCSERTGRCVCIDLMEKL